MCNLEMSKLGAEIKRLRKLQNITQIDLAANICSQPAISNIERGLVFPAIDTLYLISLRLRVSVEYLYSLIFKNPNKYIEETVEYINNCLKSKNYQDIYEITFFEMKNLRNKEIPYHFKQFIKWNHFLSAYYIKKIPYEECLTALNSLIKHKNLLVMQDYQDLRIYNSIAIIYAENNIYGKSIEEYNRILSYEELLRRDTKFHVKVLYNMSKINFNINEYIEALKIVEKGIEESIKYEDMSMLGQLYFQKGQCFEKLSYTQDEIKSNYEKAIFFLEILSYQDYVDYIKKNKLEFL